MAIRSIPKFCGHPGDHFLGLLCVGCAQVYYVRPAGIPKEGGAGKRGDERYIGLGCNRRRGAGGRCSNFPDQGEYLILFYQTDGIGDGGLGLVGIVV